MSKEKKQSLPSLPSLTGVKLGDGKFSDMLSGLFETTDPKLDQIKKSIKKLSKEGKLGNLAANLRLAAEDGFKKDLDEIGISGNAQKTYLASFNQAWQKMEMGKQSKEILNSPESKALNAFITNIENLPKLKEVINSAEPQSGWQALLKSFASKIPGLDKFVSGSFGPILSYMGLGFLVKKKTKKNVSKKPKNVAGKAGKKKPGTKEGEKKPEGPKEKLEDMPEKWVPRGRTLVMGDSNLDGNRKLKFKKKDTLDAKGGMQATWAIPRIKQMGERINGYDNLVLGFGGNDLGAVGAVEILSRYRRIVNHVRKMNKKKGGNHRTKIYIVTTPPVGDGTKLKLRGKWSKDHNGRNKERNKLNEILRGARSRSSSEFIDFDEVIDMAATVANGGISNDGLTKMAEGMNRKGDPVHVKGGEYAKRIRFGMYLSEKKDKKKNKKNVA